MLQNSLVVVPFLFKSLEVKNDICNVTIVKIGMGNPYVTENQLETKCDVRQIITIVYVTCVLKDF